MAHRGLRVDGAFFPCHIPMISSTLGRTKGPEKPLLDSLCCTAPVARIFASCVLTLRVRHAFAMFHTKWGIQDEGNFCRQGRMKSPPGMRRGGRWRTGRRESKGRGCASGSCLDFLDASGGYCLELGDLWPHFIVSRGQRQRAWRESTTCK